MLAPGLMGFIMSLRPCAPPLYAHFSWPLGIGPSLRRRRHEEARVRQRIRGRSGSNCSNCCSEWITVRQMGSPSQPRTAYRSFVRGLLEVRIFPSCLQGFSVVPIGLSCCFVNNCDPFGAQTQQRHFLFPFKRQTGWLQCRFRARCVWTHLQGSKRLPIRFSVKSRAT